MFMHKLLIKIELLEKFIKEINIVSKDPVLILIFLKGQ